MQGPAANPVQDLIASDPTVRCSVGAPEGLTGRRAVHGERVGTHVSVGPLRSGPVPAIAGKKAK